MGVVKLKKILDATTKNPVIAAVLSFCCAGLGQMYNGQYIKGILFMLWQLLNAFLTELYIGWFFYPAVMLIVVYDAYKTAKRMNLKPAI